MADGPAGLGADRFRFSGGVGLRWLLVAEEGLQIRMDLGLGEDSGGFYLGVGEVF